MVQPGSRFPAGVRAGLRQIPHAPASRTPDLWALLPVNSPQPTAGPQQMSLACWRAHMQGWGWATSSCATASAAACWCTSWTAPAQTQWVTTAPLDRSLSCSAPSWPPSRRCGVVAGWDCRVGGASAPGWSTSPALHTASARHLAPRVTHLPPPTALVHPTLAGCGLQQDGRP